MAKGTKFSFTTAEGKVETRTSARAYTHVVVGRRDLVKARASVESASNRKHHVSNWNYAKNCASVAPGEKYPEAGFTFPVDQQAHENGKARIAQYPTAEAFVDAMIAEELAKIGEGDAGPEMVLQWSQSARSANASVGSHSKWCTQVRVVELKSE